jgi:hypothetical protein
MPVWLCLLTYNGCQYHGGCKPLDGTVNSSRSVRIYLLKSTVSFSLMQLGTARDSTIGIMTVNGTHSELRDWRSRATGERRAEDPGNLRAANERVGGNDAELMEAGRRYAILLQKLQTVTDYSWTPVD